MTEPVDPAARRAWLAARRRVAEERYDTRWAPVYDDDWGGRIEATHARVMAAFLASLPRGSRILDAACGTGKYWPMILAAGYRVEGIDQSAGMLGVAAAKHPDVPLRRLGLQELDDVAAWDAVVCMDAMENVGPEDWPGVVANLRRALRPGGRLYLTVELADVADVAAMVAAAWDAGYPVVDGEDFVEGGGYHYYPGRERALRWISEAGFGIDETLEGDEYLHVVATAP